MSILDWFIGSNPAASVATGAAKGILEGVGSAANSIREAITGKLDADGQAQFDLAYQKLTQILQEGQISINLADAQSGSNFRGGWRPAIGWVCAISLGSYYIPQPLVATALWTIQCVAVMFAAPDITKVVLPSYPTMLNFEQIMGLTLSMLGLAGMRSFDKAKGTG